MTEDCPGYDRDRRMCLVRPDDCEFAPADGEVVLVLETPATLTLGTDDGRTLVHRSRRALIAE